MELAKELTQYLNQSSADVFEAALLVARHANPSLDIRNYKTILDQWGDELYDRLGSIETQRDQIAVLNRFVYKELHFSGNHQNYYDPRNSLINEVIERRTGIPLTLSIVYMELARRVGIELEGTSFPGHFLVKLPLAEGLVVLDPFNKGISLGEDDLKQILINTKLTPNETLLKSALRSPTPAETIVRMLRNLKIVYQKQGEKSAELEILNLMLEIDPDLMEELRERGLLLRELECAHSALDDLIRYLANSESEAHVDSIRTAILELQRNLTPLH